MFLCPYCCIRPFPELKASKIEFNNFRSVKTAESQEGVPVQILARQAGVGGGERGQVGVRVRRPTVVGIPAGRVGRQYRGGQPARGPGALQKHLLLQPLQPRLRFTRKELL